MYFWFNFINGPVLFTKNVRFGISRNGPAVYEVGGGIKGLCEAKTAAANLPK